MVELYKHQKSFLNKNPNKTILVWECGTGKTRTAIEWMKLRDGAGLIVCPKALTTNWKRELEKWGDASVVFSKEQFRKYYDSLARHDMIVVDECVLKGSKIKITASNYKKIEDIKIGETVLNANGFGFVKNKSKRIVKKINHILINGKYIHLTDNHPIFTINGWVIASHLQKNDIILTHNLILDIMSLGITFNPFKKYAILFNLWKEKYNRKSWKENKIMLKELYFKIHVEEEQKKNDIMFEKVLSRQSRKSEEFFEKNDNKKSNEESGGADKGEQNPQKNKSSAKNNWWQWKKNSITTKIIMDSIRKWMDFRIPRANKDKKRIGVSDMLQNRYSKSTKNDWDRSEWEFSWFIRKTKTRQEKDKTSYLERVENIYIQESRNSFEYRNGFEVYNLEVSNHPSYFVDDFLVHNCHHFAGQKSAMSKSLLKYIKKHEIKNILLLTATPYTSSPWSIYVLARYLGYEWSWIKFRDKFFTDRYIGRRVVPQVKEGMEEEIAELIRKIGDVVRLDECADIPEQVFEVERFALTPEQEKAIKENTDTNPIVRFTKYHQIQQGCIKGDGYEPDKTFPNAKNERIRDYCEQTDKVAVVCRYNLQIDVLARELSDIGKPIFIIRGDVKDRDAVVQEIDKIDKCIVLVQADCGVGFELPSISLMIFASLSFSYVSYKQMCGRILRINRLHKNVYIHLLSGDIDEAVYDAIKRKENFDVEMYGRERLSD